MFDPFLKMIVLVLKFGDFELHLGLFFQLLVHVLLEDCYHLCGGALLGLGLACAQGD